LLRYLRIAFTAFCGLACVLLVMLWVRNRYVYDSLHGPISGETLLILTSRHDGLAIGLRFGEMQFRDGNSWQTNAFPTDLRRPDDYATAYGFSGRNSSEFKAVHIPYWFLVPLSATLAAIPWIRWRFSLRTLLIAITLVAVVLGVIAWVSR
jgi:hypothetical protein